MKKLFLWILFIILAIPAQAWMSTTYSVSYDGNFNPIISVELTNSTSNTINNIDFVIFIRKKGASQWDVMAVKELHVNQPTNMRPSNKQNFKLNPNIPSGWEVDKVGVEKIRFSDGSIKQY